MRANLKEKIDTAIELSELIDISHVADSSFVGKVLDSNIDYFTIKAVFFSGIMVFQSGERLILDYQRQGHNYIFALKNNKPYPISKSNIKTNNEAFDNFRSSYNILKSRYISALEFINTVERDVSLNGIVNDPQIEEIAERLLNIPNYDSNNIKLIVARLKSEILDIQENNR